MFQIIPKPTAELVKRYQDYCAQNNVALVTYFSVLAIIVFGLQLIHHLRLGMEIFSASMILYTLLYAFNIMYAIVNLLVLPKMRNVQALQGLSVLLQIAYMFFMAIVFSILGGMEVIQERGPVAFVVGMLVISIMLQGHYFALLILLTCCWILLSVGLFYSLPWEQAMSPIMTCFIVIIVSAVIARLIEKSRIQLFLMTEEINQKNQLLIDMSDNDPLTSLSNRKYFTQALDTEIARAIHYNHSLGLLLINIDDFKLINNELSHKAGDQLLCDIATLISQQQQEMNVVCRYNGDEFGVLLVDTNTTQSMEVAQRIHSKVASHDFSLEGRSITVSIGHTQYRGQTANKFIECADKILCESKRLGKNRVTSDSL